MIPIILYSRQPYSRANGPYHGIVEGKLEEERVFLGEVSGLMDGKDLRNSAPVAQRLLAKRLSVALEATIGAAATRQTLVVPIIDKSTNPSQHDTLRALLVITPPESSCEYDKLGELAAAFSRRWKRAARQECPQISKMSEFSASIKELTEQCAVLEPDFPFATFTYRAGRALTPSLHHALRPIEAMLQSNVLAMTTPPTLEETASRPMIPLILQATQEYTERGVMSFGPMYHDHLWVVDLNDYMGRDTRAVDASSMEALASTLQDTLVKVAGQKFADTARVCPLFEPTMPLEVPLQDGQEDTRPDHLRGVVVRLPNVSSCDIQQLAEVSQEVVELWQKHTGQECAPLAQLPEFKLEAKQLMESIDYNLPAVSDKFTVEPGVEVNKRFEALLQAIAPCVKSSQLARSTVEAFGESRVRRRI